MARPLVPKDWKTTRALQTAKTENVAFSPRGKQRFNGGKVHPCFNGSQNNKKNKKRPITLPGNWPLTGG